MKSRAGPKRHRIKIQRRLPGGYDSRGESQPAWLTLLECWARIRDDSQREFTAALQVQSDKQVHIEIRDPRMQLTTKDRIVHVHPVHTDPKTGQPITTVYDIRAILTAENRSGEDWVLMCTEHSTE